MTGLRQETIKAAAKADWPDYVAWETLHEDDRAASLQGATASLDAILDYLEANAAIPMFQSSLMGGTWVECDGEDADILAVDIAALRDPVTVEPEET